MKILQLGKFYPIFGGVEKVMWNLTKGISERKVDCDMLCAVFRDNVDRVACGAGGRWVEQLIEFNDHGQCICTPANHKVASTMISPAMIFWLRSHCREYDIIHIHHPDPMACVALFFSGYKGKVVLHWHSDILRQKTLMKFYSPLQNWLVKRADVILGTSPVYVQKSPYLQEAQDKISVLPIGIEDKLRQVSSERTDGRKVVFSLGRLVPYKGFEYLIDAAKYLPDNYEIRIGGSGPLRTELENRIEEAGLGRKVKLIGQIPEDRLPDAFSSCDVYVMSSRMKTEAFGIVQVEAMSCGKPVVATHIPDSGVDWVNEDGVSGINVPVEDSRAIAEAIMEICEDEGKYRQYCLQARERFESMFTMDKMIDGALSVYEKLLAK